MKKNNSVAEKVKIALRLDRAVRFVWRASPGWTIVSTALFAVQGVLPLLVLYMMKLIIDGVTSALTAPDKIEAFQHVAMLIGLTAAIALLTAACRLAESLVKEAQTLAVSDYMYKILHSKSISVDLEYYENPQYFDTLRRAQQEGPYRPLQITNNLFRLGRSSISLVAILGLLFSFHWIVAFILVVAAIPGVMVKIKYSGRIFNWQRSRTQTERKAGYFNQILTGDFHAKELRLFRLGDLFIQRFGKLRKLLRTEKIDISRKRSVADFIAQAWGILAVFSAFGLIAYRTVLGVITLGGMVMYFQAFQRGLGFLREMLGGLADLYENNLFISNLYEFLDIEPKIKEPARPQPFPKPIQKGICFDHVYFQYPFGKRKVLEDISFSIPPGDVIALVGGNGSGKTTLIKLLCRLYDPLEGTITFDDIDLREFKLDSLRQQISIIFQDYVQYHLTARENIWLGNLALSPKDEKIKKAARYAGAAEMINQLPKGYETVLGKWFKDGEQLSIGEWQKIALARAFLGKSQVIVLDEPTSSLDVNTEYEIFRRFKQLLQGRSAILISHRFSTVRMADRILVLENGRIKENGSHEDLVNLGGTYAKLFEKQAQYYR